MTDEPFLRIVRGDPTPEEVAALVAVLTARAQAAAGACARAASKRRPPGWADRSRQLRQSLPHGVGAWRASALPH